MKGYKSVSIDEKIIQAINKIIKSEKYYYRSKSDFINSCLREKLHEIRKLQLKEREIELLEKK